MYMGLIQYTLSDMLLGLTRVVADNRTGFFLLLGTALSYGIPR